MHISRPDWFSGNVPWLFAGRALRSFSQALLVVIVPLYVAALGYSTVQVGYLLSIALAGSTAMTLAVGVFSDRYGRKIVLMVVAALAAIGTLTCAFTGLFWVLALMAALASIRGGGAGSGGGFGPFYPAEQALIAGSSSDRNRNAVFSSLSFVGVLAGAAGSAAALLPAVIQRQFHTSLPESFRPLFWIASAASLSIIVLVIPIREAGAAATVTNQAHNRLTARRLIGRLWLTNGINGLAIGVLGLFLTYWLMVRYSATSSQIAALYTAANLLTAGAYFVAPWMARRLGSVQAIVITRLGTVAFMAGVALAPTFLLASAAYAVRIIVNSIGIPIRQSFVMGVSDERNRSRVAAIGSLPSQATGMVAPTIASYLFQSVSEVAPIWLATGAMAINALLFELLFREVKPPEEE